MNLTKELNESICPIAEDCLFYTKPIYHTPSEVNFYKDYCLNAGINCGMKKHYDVSERLKRIEKEREELKKRGFDKSKTSWRSK